MHEIRTIDKAKLPGIRFIHIHPATIMLDADDLVTLLSVIEGEVGISGIANAIERTAAAMLVNSDPAAKLYIAPEIMQQDP